MLSTDAKLNFHYRAILTKVFFNSAADLQICINSTSNYLWGSMTCQHSNQISTQLSESLYFFWERSQTTRNRLPLPSPPSVSLSTCLPEGYEWSSWLLVLAHCNNNDRYYDSQNVTKWRTGMRQIIKCNELELGNKYQRFTQTATNAHTSLMTHSDWVVVNSLFMTLSITNQLVHKRAFTVTGNTYTHIDMQSVRRDC